MRVAALTFTYNEATNLPIWRRYYGAQLGEKNLFVIDRESDDGSTDDLGEINRILLPRTPFDDVQKVVCMSSFQNGLLSHYDAVICGDCDEMVVPEPDKYAGLVDYITKMDGDYATCVGVDVLHIIDREPPLEPDRPILSQRHYGRFQSVGCKTLVSRVPIRWEPGLHFSNKRPRFDCGLINFHLKWMDYQSAVRRQAINQATAWSENSLAANHGAHHRYNLEKFVREGFLDPANVVRQGKVGSFDVSDAIAELEAGVVEKGGIFFSSPHLTRWVEIPLRFSDLL